eukprot:CAMPEP_0196745522 /NCGR_PEP_ID=MMETSP1091-20130531/62061_1 /TAXON_ID=302021 /ORGANISM="Rhodomonas sp., Strain CCMP768" /LENGTH=79 /DNA_ID=CAMNT_0042092289 /DNA_START=387 /DNA_END=622 /DNA_ORIENTATION=-
MVHSLYVSDASAEQTGARFPRSFAPGITHHILPSAAIRSPRSGAVWVSDDAGVQQGDRNTRQAVVGAGASPHLVTSLLR